MTLDTLLLMVLTLYLTLIAYGVVRARKRQTGVMLRVTEALLVLVLPAVLTGYLLADGEADLVRQWWRLFALMPVIGAVVAILTDRIARKVAR